MAVEWIEHHDTWGALKEKLNYEVPAGTVLELMYDKLVLVGDINPMGGVCDDCTLLDPEDTVLRYTTINWQSLC